MVFFNYSTMQMAAKVVYYGPGLCGKTTNLQWIYGHTSNDSRGEMVSLATETDRTLFFDLLPIDVGSIAGFSTRIQLYTVPGQVFYNTTRKLVLKGVDGVVFVADSQRPMLQANKESFQNLEENLAEMGLSLDTIPLVLQYNKRDLPNICSLEELDQALNRQGWATVEASAIDGSGVFETLKTVSKATLLALKKRLTKGRPESAAAAPARAAVAAPPKAAPVAAPAAAPPKPAPAPAPAAAPAAAAKPAAEPAPQAPAAEAPAAAADPHLDATRPEPVPARLEPEDLDTAEAEAVAPEVAAASEPAGEDVSEPEAAEPEIAEPETVEPETEPEELDLAEPESEPEELDLAETETAEPAAIAAEPAATPQPAPVAARPPAAAATPAPAASGGPAARRPSRPRASGIDALAELEKIRQTTLSRRPAAAVPARNGRSEISRDFALRLDRGDLQRARRFSLVLRVEDAERRVVDERGEFHVDIDDASAVEKLLLRLNIAVDAAP